MKLSHVIFALAVLPATVFAQTEESQTTQTKELQYEKSDGIKGYIGLNLNYVKGQLNDAWGEEFSYATGYDVDTDDLINPNNIGFSFNAGAQFNKYFGLEGFLEYTARSTAEIDFYDAGKINKLANYKAKVSSLAFGLDAMGYAPIADSKFSFVGSLGAGYYKFNSTIDVVNYTSGLSVSDSGDEKNLAFRIGIGGQYAFSDNFAMRGMVRYVALDYDDDEDVVEGLVDISLGIKLTF